MIQEVQANSIHFEYISLFCSNILLSKWTSVKQRRIILLEICMNIRLSKCVQMELRE